MFFCERIKSKKGAQTHLKLEKDFTFSIFDSADAVNEKEWTEVVNGYNFFLELNYLKILEQIGDTFEARYVVVYKNKLPHGVIYFQIINFEAKNFGDLLDTQLKNLQSSRSKLFEKYIDENEKEVLMRLLTCGNNIVTGEHAFLFKKELPKNKNFDLVDKVIDQVGANEKLRGKVSIVLVKDFYTPINNPTCLLGSEKYMEFNVEPNMVVDIPAEAKTLEQYIALFSKKYRNRAKGILKLGAGMVTKELSLEEVKKENDVLFDLYEQVYNKAKFKLIKLPPNYFYECKKQFGDKFFVTGFYLNDKLMAFCTGFEISAECIEAHYIGFDYELNKEMELYQNILYKLIDITIARGRTKLNLGRTASEIKSTVGAKEHPLTCYIRPQNTLSKVVLKPFVQFLQPSEWVPRNPFKE